MYNFLKKYIWIIFISCLLIGFYLKHLQSIEIPTKKHYNIEHIDTGEVEKKDFIEYDNMYTIYNIGSTIFLSLGIALFLLIVIDKKIEESVSEEKQRIAENDRLEFENRIVELQNIIQNDVFEGTLKRIIPSEIFNLLKSKIFLSDFVRKDIKWIYNVSSRDNKIIVVQTVSLTLQNVKNIDALEEFSIKTTKTDEQEIEIESVLIDGKEIKIEPIDKNHYKYSIDLKKSEEKSFSLSIKNTYFNDSIRDLQITLYPMVNLEIQVFKEAGLKVSLEGTFSEELEYSTKKDDLIIFKPISAVLPGQGILYTVEKQVKKTSQ